jgi:hypothetical protein
MKIQKSKMARDSHVLTTQVEEVKASLAVLLNVLSDKERYVVTHRYALDGTKRSTLAQIGRHFQVTRERIRQIEKYALKKLQRAAASSDLLKISAFVKQLLITHGGVMAQNRVLSELDRFLPHVDQSLNPELKLIASLDFEIIQVGNTVNFYPHFRLRDVTFADIRVVSRHAATVLNERKIVMTLEQVVIGVQERIGYDHPAFKSSFIRASLYVDKRIKVEDGEVSLYDWRHVNPRTLREKIRFILTESNRPLHFMDLAEEITQKEFDTRKVSLQAVHNELINCEEFVLIGRGIYALGQWGYSEGTVADVISTILKDNGPLYADQLIKLI